MKTVPGLTIAAAVAAALQGCAGSGGAGDNDVLGDTLPELLLCAPLGVCGGRLGADQKTTSTPTPLTSWAEQRGDRFRVQASGPHSLVTYDSSADGSLRAIHSPSVGNSESAVIYYDDSGKLGQFVVGGAEFYGGQHGFPRLPFELGIDVTKTFLNPGDQPTPFAELATRDVGVVANPYALGWNYQSFGAWNDHATGTSAGNIGVLSFGAGTPVSSIPTSGSATFTGKFGGLYVSPQGEGSLAAGNLSVHANFSARSLDLSSSGTTLARDLSTATAAPHLNLSGTLTYAPGTNAFSGTLTNAGGTMSGTSNGQFYGPAAQELGGVFTVKSPTTVETFAGAYGAKR